MSEIIGFFVGLPLGILVGALFIVFFVKRRFDQKLEELAALALTKTKDHIMLAAREQMRAKIWGLGRLKGKNLFRHQPTDISQ